MVNAQKKVQAELFLTQTAQTTLESMGRQIRYGYNYTGSTESAYVSNNQSIIINLNDTSNTTGSSATTTQNLVQAESSPFILFESLNGVRQISRFKGK
jgi:hypothetical protein